MPHRPLFSHVQAVPLLAARAAGATAIDSSLDLGLTTTGAEIQPDRVLFASGEWLSWQTVADISKSDTACYALAGDDGVEKIQRFSEEFNRLYSLMPTESAPTMLISGIPMHRIKNTNPQKDTRAKIRAAGPFTGAVLDTATGLGYTAIAAAETATSITTVELDPTATEICRANPWSQGLFDNPAITQLYGDSFDVVEELADEAFSQIIHDPPMFNLAGHLYSADFYRELLRVLQPRGRLYHYIGNPDSKSGRSVTRGVLDRLQQAGFTRIKRQPRAFGVVAHKP